MIKFKYVIPKEFKMSTNKIYAWIFWTKRKKISDFYHSIVYSDAQKFDTLTEKVNIKMNFYWKSRVLDSSNCTFIWKCLEDWLVKWWLLEDDTNKYVWKFSCESIHLTPAQRKTLDGDYVVIEIN